MMRFKSTIIVLVQGVILTGLTFTTALSRSDDSATAPSCHQSFTAPSLRPIGNKIYERTKKDLSRFGRGPATLLRTISNLKDLRDLEFLSEIILLTHPQSQLMRSAQKSESVVALSERDELFTTGAHFRLIQGTTPLSTPLVLKNIHDEYSTVTITHNPKTNSIEFAIQTNTSFSDYDLQLQRYRVESDWSELQPYFSESKKDVLFSLGGNDKIVKVDFSRGENKVSIETESDTEGVKTKKQLVLKLSESQGRLDSIYYSEQGRRNTILFPANYYTQFEFKLLPFL